MYEWGKFPTNLQNWWAKWLGVCDFQSFGEKWRELSSTLNVQIISVLSSPLVSQCLKNPTSHNDVDANTPGFCLPVFCVNCLAVRVSAEERSQVYRLPREKWGCVVAEGSLLHPLLNIPPPTHTDGFLVRGPWLSALTFVLPTRSQLIHR